MRAAAEGRPFGAFTPWLEFGSHRRIDVEPLRSGMEAN